MDSSDKHLIAKIGQYILIHDSENKILLLRRKKSQNWSLPGGRLNDNDKSWKEALVREIKEETGITISDIKPFDIKLIEDPYQTKYCVFFTSQDILDLSNLTISPEHDSVEWIDEINIDNLKIDDEPNIRQVLKHYFSDKN